MTTMSKILYGKRWPEDFPYRFFIGMHTVDTDQNRTIPHLLRDIDGREIVRQLADAGVDAIYFYASCHCGSCFYPTDIKPGHVHSRLKGKDVFGEAADECQKRKIAFLACYEFMNLRLAAFGPKEWMHYYPEATPPNKGLLCWNTGYGEFVMKQIEEIAKRYPMAGIFVDMLDHAGLVCCEGCSRRFKDEFGGAPPRRIDINSPLYKAFKLWCYQDEARYLKELRGILQSYQPDATMVNNSHILACEDLYETTAANDYVSTDPAMGYASKRGTLSLSSLMAVFRALSRGKYPFEILHDPILYGLLYAAPPKAYNAITAMAHAQGASGGYPSSMLDQYGKLNRAVLDLTARNSAFVKQRYPWKAQGEPLRLAGLYLSQETELFYAYGSSSVFIGNGRYMDEFNGAYLMLQQAHWPTDILTRRDLKRLSEYPVIYLPNAVCLSDKEIEAFREYVRLGGVLVASYRTSFCNEWNEPRPDFGLADVLGVNFRGRKIEPFQALQMLLPDNLFVTEAWENRNISLPQSALICAARAGAKVLINLHDRYRTDPGIPTRAMSNAYTKEEPEGPAVVENRYGQGRCFYFAGKIFSAYAHTGMSTLKKLATQWIIGDLVRGKSVITLQAPVSVEMTAYAQPRQNRILIHLVNYQSVPGRLHMPMDVLPVTEEVLPVYGLELETKFHKDEIVKATLQPAGRELKVAKKNNQSVIIIPEVQIHEIVELSLKPGVCPEYPDSNQVFDYPRLETRQYIRAWLATNPAGYDPNDNGVISFKNWRPAEDFLINWLFVGPFTCEPKKGLDTVFPPETDCAPDATYAGKDGATVTWNEMIGLDRTGTACIRLLVANEPNIVAYALCYLKSAQQQKARFWVGCDDACKIFVNNQECFVNPGSKKPRPGPDQAVFETELKAGYNTVLIKIVDIGHDMEFFLRLENPKFDVFCSAGPDKPGRKAGSKSVAEKEWDGRGAMQV